MIFNWDGRHAEAAGDFRQDPTHTMHISMMQQNGLPSRGGDVLPLFIVSKISFNKSDQFLKITVYNKMLVKNEQFAQSIFCQIVCDQQRSAPQCLKNTHVHIVSKA